VDITYIAVQDGGSSSTKTSTSIKLSFSEALSGLTAEDINVDNDVGSVTKGALTGSGAVWTLALTEVTTQGNIKVSISRSGIENGVKTVAVYKAVAAADITYTAVASGASSVTTSTNITLTFSAAVTGLTAADITLNGVTGAATKGGLTGSGTSWTLALTEVTTQGTVTVAISKTGIEAAEKTVAVYKAADLPTLGGTVSITGTAKIGETLTVNISALTGQAGTLSYQWKAGDGDVGTNQSTYTPEAADVGKTITVTVSSSGNSGSVTSTATGVVAAISSGYITVGFNYGEITITGDNGNIIISKSGANTTPTSLQLSASGDYTGVTWYVDGNTTGISGNSVTLSGAVYDVREHSITFTGTANGHRFSSQSITFTVLN
jgi:hypothetical protein